jgi:hypothetical protein
MLARKWISKTEVFHGFPQYRGTILRGVRACIPQSVKQLAMERMTWVQFSIASGFSSLPPYPEQL